MILFILFCINFSNLYECVNMAPIYRFRYSSQIYNICFQKDYIFIYNNQCMFY